ncbi:MAG: hypothetical protein JXR43_10890 [Burkholderiaceae bacterium]|nr:hypothetical protein [Burkholderiaceae bacterium]
MRIIDGGIPLSPMLRIDHEKTMDFMTSIYLTAALVVLMKLALVTFVAYLANQPGGVIEIGSPRWIMPKQIARVLQLQRGETLR